MPGVLFLFRGYSMPIPSVKLDSIPHELTDTPCIFNSGTDHRETCPDITYWFAQRLNVSTSYWGTGPVYQFNGDPRCPVWDLRGSVLRIMRSHMLPVICSNLLKCVVEVER